MNFHHFPEKNPWLHIKDVFKEIIYIFITEFKKNYRLRFVFSNICLWPTYLVLKCIETNCSISSYFGINTENFIYIYSSARTFKEIYPKVFCFDSHLGLNPHWKTKFSVKVAMIHDQLQVMSGEKKPSEVIEIFNSQVS